MPSPAADSTLRAHYRQEFERLRGEFDANGSGAATVRDRTAVVDKLAIQLWEQNISHAFRLRRCAGRVGRIRPPRAVPSFRC